MRTLISCALIAVLTWVSLPALASNEAECSKILDRVGVVNVHRRWTGEECFLSVSPYRGPGLIYRNYLFTDEGQLMVFNSYGDGDASKDTGARVFFIFPRGATPSVAAVDQELVVQLATQNVRMKFETTKGQITEFSPGSFTEEWDVRHGNQGGVEISNQGVLMLDVGYKTGDSPITNPNRKSIFYDGFGKACQVTNRDIFRYRADGDADFKFTDADLKAFLAKKCSQLKVTF